MAMVMMGSALAMGPAAALAAVDRSALSVDENVVINTVCSPKRTAGESAYSACVAAQVAALQTHPSPDRSALSASRNRAVEQNCAHLRRQGIGEYNDCLKKAMAAPTTTAEAEADDDLRPNIAKVFTKAIEEKPAPTTAAAAPAAPLPSPGKALPKRPDTLERQALSAADLYKKVERSVFVVLATPSVADARARNIAQGSAVAVSDHLLLTNCHVVKDRPVIRIIQGNTADDATLIAADAAADRCVLKAEHMTLVPVTGIRAFDSLAVGERVFAVGAPHSLERTMSEGLVSGLRHQRSRNLVQTSAPVSPGSSGGGLFDERGNLVGITTLGSIYGAQNLNFAVSAGDFWQ